MVRRCPRHAAIQSVGCEVLVFAEWDHSISDSWQWSPDGAALLALTGTRTDRQSTLCTFLSTFSVKSGQCWSPPLDLDAMPRSVAWSPDSRLVLAVGLTEVQFMDRSTRAAWSQQIGSWAPLPKVCVSADWSSAGLVCLTYCLGIWSYAL